MNVWVKDVRRTAGWTSEIHGSSLCFLGGLKWGMFSDVYI